MTVRADAAQACWVPAAVDLFGVAGEQVLDEAVEPAAACRRHQAEGRLREAARQEQLHVPAEIRCVRCRHEVVAGRHPIEERHE